MYPISTDCGGDLKKIGVPIVNKNNSSNNNSNNNNK